MEKMKRSSSSPSESLVNKKLKVEEKAEETTMEDEKPVTPPMRECEFCGKKFSSGKALGGHKRFHLQLLRKEKELADKLAAAAVDDGGGGGGNTKLLSSLDSPPTEKLICCLCNKEFPSEKALFGHMRSHPGREWRGIHPPTEGDEDKNSMEAVLSPVSSSSPSIDVAKSLPRSWSRTGIRGREGIFDAILAGIVAIMVDKGRENIGREEEEEEKGNLVKEERNLKRKKRVLSDNNMNDEVTTMKNRKLILRLKTRPHHEEDNISGDGRHDGIIPAEEGFKCKICEKYFATFQALRVHRSSHNKEKKNKSHKDDNDDAIEESSEPSKSSKRV